MAEAGKEEVDDELSALLDSALTDFGRVRNTDDELDSMMETMDQQAVEKAAQKFDEVMKRTFQEGAPSTRQVDSPNFMEICCFRGDGIPQSRMRMVEFFLRHRCLVVMVLFQC